MSARLGIFKLMNIQILSETDIKHSVSILCHIIVICIEQFIHHIISGLIKQPKESCYSRTMTIGKHTRHILCDKEEWLFITQNSYILKEKLSSCIFYSFQCAGFTPRLAWRTTYYAGNIIGEFRAANVSNITLN